MGKYTNIPCAHCGKPFAEGDDVVVCPICGAPHHRQCYLELGHCANAAKHATGMEWQPPHHEATSDPNAIGEKICPKCGAKNPPEGIFCSYCGTKLDNSAQYQADSPAQQAPYNSGPYGRQMPGADQAQQPAQVLETPAGPVTPDELFDEVSAKEISIFVGPNSRYFLSQFKIMKETGRSYTLNWSAFFFNLFYFLYRKLTIPTVIVATILAVLTIPDLLYTNEYVKYFITTSLNHPIPFDQAFLESMSLVVRVANMLHFALIFALGLYFNKLYYKHVITSIKKIKANFAMTVDNRPYYNALAKGGRTNMGLTLLVGIAIAIGYLTLSYMLVYQYLI